MNHRFPLSFLVVALWAFVLSPFMPVRAADSAATMPRKVEDIVIYQDEKFYSAFPSIVKRRNGELIVAFRRAPERRRLGEKNSSHTDPNSYLVLIR